MPLADFLSKLNILDPRKTKVILEERENSLRLLVDGKLLTGLMPAKPFPITYPNFTIFRDSYGVDVCIVKNCAELDPESKKNLQIILDKAYFIPIISKIIEIETSGDECAWETTTDRGPAKFRTRGRMSVISMGNRIIITDTNDNVYEIEDIDTLDARSKEEFEATL